MRIIGISRKTLSDGSHVFNVHLTGCDPLPAVTEQDASDLAEKIRDAINAHTCDEAKIRIHSSYDFGTS